MLKNEYDVVIVGAGPSGSMAARTIAESGASVALLEKDREIGVPVRCAEGTSLEPLKKYINIDPRWVASEIKTFRFYSPEKKYVDMNSPSPGVVLHRRIFDYALAEKAAEKGAQVFTKSYVYDVSEYTNGYRKIKIDYIGEKREIKAKIVIAADGVESRVARFVGIKTNLDPFDIDVCAQMTMTNLKNFSQDRIEFWIGNKWAPGGYVWIFPKGENTANIGLGINGIYRDKGKALDYLKTFVKVNYPEAVALNTIAGGVPVSKHLEALVKDGFMVIGDAARQVNPITGGGILSGLASGKMAGEFAAQALQKSDTSIKQLMEYQKQWNKTIGKDYTRFYRIKKRTITMSDAEFCRIADEFQGVPVKDVSLLKIFKAAVKNNPKILADVIKAFAGF